MDTNTTHGSVKKTDNLQSDSKQLVQSEPIEGTPFTAIKFDEKWYLTLGKYRLTEGMNTLAEVIEDSKDASWWRIMQIIQLMIDENKTTKTAQAHQEIQENIINLNKSNN